MKKCSGVYHIYTVYHEIVHPLLSLSLSLSFTLFLYLPLSHTHMYIYIYICVCVCVCVWQSQTYIDYLDNSAHICQSIKRTIYTGCCCCWLKIIYIYIYNSFKPKLPGFYHFSSSSQSRTNSNVLSVCVSLSLSLSVSIRPYHTGRPSRQHPLSAQSYILAEGETPPTKFLDMTQNNLIVRLQ